MLHSWIHFAVWLWLSHFHGSLARHTDVFSAASVSFDRKEFQILSDFGVSLFFDSPV